MSFVCNASTECGDAPAEAEEPRGHGRAPPHWGLVTAWLGTDPSEKRDICPKDVQISLLYPPLGGIMAPAETGHQGYLEGAAVSAPVAILGACVGVAGLTGQRIEEVGGARSAVAEDDLTRPG